MSLCLIYVIKLTWGKCDKNISNKNYAKLINYVHKMKRTGSNCPP